MYEIQPLTLVYPWSIPGAGGGVEPSDGRVHHKPHVLQRQPPRHLRQPRDAGQLT